MYIGTKPIPRKFSQSDIRSSYPPRSFWESCFPHKVSSCVEPEDITFCFFFWLPQWAPGWAARPEKFGSKAISRRRPVKMPEDVFPWQQRPSFVVWTLTFFPYRKTIWWVEKISLTEAFASYGLQSHGGWSTCEILSIYWIRHCVEHTSTTESGNIAGHHSFSIICGLSKVPWLPLGLSFTCY